MHKSISASKIPIANLTAQSETESENLEAELSPHKSLMDVLAWAKGKLSEEVHRHVAAEVITQDEFTHDVIVPYRNFFLVYDTN